MTLKLVVDGRRNLGSVMPISATPEPGKRIKYPTSILADEVILLGRHDDPQVFVKLTIGGKRHPVGGG